MKTAYALAGVILLVLAGCQLPGPLATGPKSQPGTAALSVVLLTNGFRFVPQSGVQNGRFVVPPSVTPGKEVYAFHSTANPALDFLRDTDTGLLNLPPGPWDLTVTLYDVGGKVLGTSAVQSITLVAGENATVPIVIYATQGGTGTLNVTYTWDGFLNPIDNVSFTLTRLALSAGPPYTVTETPVTPVLSTIDLTGHTASVAMDLVSGSYRLVFQSSYAGASHPSVSATAEIYDNIVSTAAVPLMTGQLNGPPDAPTSLILNFSAGDPYLTWVAPPSTATAYRLYGNGVQIGTDLITMVSSVFDTNSYVAGAAIDYDLRAVNVFGESIPTPFVHYQTVGSVTLTPSGPIRQELGAGPAFSTVIGPSDATNKGYSFLNSDSGVASLSSMGILKALAIGTTEVSAVSEQGAVTSALATVKVEPMVSTFAGYRNNTGTVDSSGNAARFHSPTAITRAPDGSMYVVDNDTTATPPTYTLRKIGLDSVVTTIPLTGTPIPDAVTAMTVDSGGNLYFVVGSGIYKCDTSGIVSALAGVYDDPGNLGGTAGSARFNYPLGLVDVSGLLYVSDTGNHVIKIVDAASGTTYTYAGTGTPGGTNGDVLTATFNEPRGIVYNGVDALYVATYGSYTLRKIALETSPNTVSTIAGMPGTPGGADGLGSAAQFWGPEGLALDGNFLYVADTANVIRRVQLPGPGNTDAKVVTVAGTGLADGVNDGFGSDATLGTVKSVVAQGGAAYVADTMHHTIRMVQTSVYDLIYTYDPIFSDGAVMKYHQGNYIPVGDGLGVGGVIRVGAILLYTTSQGNHGKMLITGIDTDYNGSGHWRLYYDWTTWTDAGSLVSRGSSHYYDQAEGAGASLYKWLDLDTGGLANGSAGYGGDLYFFGDAGVGNRYIIPDNSGLPVGVYE